MLIKPTTNSLQKFNALFFTTFAVLVAGASVMAADLRPPSVPLVTCDPYFSIWSPGDKLTDVNTTHWTGKAQRLTGLVKIDGQNFRVLGAEPVEVAALPQTQLEVLPTRTIYTFEGAGVELKLTFMTTDLPEDLDILARPVTYVTWEASVIDGKDHQVAVYFDASSEIACNTPDQAVNFQNVDTRRVNAWRVGTTGQPILEKKGDDLRIDWGYFHLATESSQEKVTAATATAARGAFLSSGKLRDRILDNAWIDNDRNDTVLTCTLNLAPTAKHSSSAWLMLAYDDLYSIQYMGKNLRPYWRRNGWEAADLLKAAAHDYKSLQKRCAKFDEEFMADLRNTGGENYAELGALAFRQCFAAGKFVSDANGQPLQFCKENHSNGCISTSDVFYPMSPQFLLFGPTLAKSFIVPFMNYAASERWKFPFAPHDLGKYPKADGQVYGGGESDARDQMPVEESGNLLILFAAVAEMEGNAKFAGLYWKQLEQWADYLKEKGFDPEKQLCTDDFAGHLAHNANLSVKAICGLGAFAKLCEMRGNQAKAEEFHKLAVEFAQRWMQAADDGDHYRLALDKPDTWSQKYNLVWDKVLGLNLFPDSVARKEMDYYKKHQNEYGLPLDNRKTYTKLDWITWTATLTENQDDFAALIAPVLHFINSTPDRSPLTDWYETQTARKVGFTGRPVIGGVFMRMLYEKSLWRKYARRDHTKAKDWAPMPKPPVVTTIIPAADTAAAVWNYTTIAPPENWIQPGFDDSTWKNGSSGFGTAGTPGAVIGTVWSTDDIWLRREVELPADRLENLCGWLHHDEDAEVYINGVPGVKARSFITGYEVVPLSAEGKAALKPGKNLIAIHCHQTTGGQYIDFGLIEFKNN